MTDVTTGQAPTTATPDAQPTSTDATGTTQATDKAQTFDAEYVANLRKEAAGYRVKLKALEDKAKQDEDAKLGEAEKLAKQNKELAAKLEQYQAMLKTERIKFAVSASAGRLGLDPDLAQRLIDPTQVEYDEEHGASDPEKHLKELVKKWPQLAKQVTPPPPSINAGDGRGAGAPPDRKAQDDDLKRRYRIS